MTLAAKCLPFRGLAEVKVATIAIWNGCISCCLDLNDRITKDRTSVEVLDQSDEDGKKEGNENPQETLLSL